MADHHLDEPAVSLDRAPPPGAQSYRAEGPSRHSDAGWLSRLFMPFSRAQTILVLALVGWAVVALVAIVVVRLMAG